MKRLFRFLAGPAAALAVVVAMTTAAQAAWWGSSTSYYNIYYSSSSQYSLITKTQAYLYEAFWSAYRVLGKRGWTGKITIYFYSENSSTLGYTQIGSNSLYLNTANLGSLSGAYIGSVIAHETSHILFGNYTKATNWNSDNRMWNYCSFLTEALAYYTGNVSYAYGERYTVSAIKSGLTAAYAQTHRILSWWVTADWYNNWDRLSSAQQDQVHWQFRAAGYFLNSGLTKACYSALGTTLDSLRTYASTANSKLASFNGRVAEAAFEQAFKDGYGYYANAAWMYGSYNNTSYLYGKFYTQFYN